jgi:drug/metabolite transporter (DMT)-like permease
MNLSVLIMGHTTLFAKLIPFSAPVIIEVRSWIAFFALSLFLAIRGKIRTLLVRRKRDLIFFFGMGVLLCLHWVTYFHSIQVSTIAIGMISLFTYPVFTAILEPLFFSIPFQRAELGLAGLVLVGLVFVASPWESWDLLVGGSSESSSSGSGLGTGALAGVGWGLVSSLLYAIRNLLSKRNLVHYSGAVLMNYQLLVSGLVLIAFFPNPGEIRSEREVIGFFVLGLGFTALPHVLMLESLQRMKATTVGILSTLSPVYGTIAAWIYLGEVPRPWTLVGGSIVLVASCWEMLRVSRRTRIVEPES